MFFDFLNEQQKEAIILRLSSFLRWVYNHNPEFRDTLTVEEITNTWMNDFIHDEWITQKFEEGNVLFIAHVNEYIHAYASVAHNFQIEIEPKIKPKDVNATFMPKKRHYRETVQIFAYTHQET